MHTFLDLSPVISAGIIPRLKAKLRFFVKVCGPCARFAARPATQNDLKSVLKCAQNLHFSRVVCWGTAALLFVPPSRVTATAL